MDNPPWGQSNDLDMTGQTTPPTSGKRYLVVFNPKSGQGDSGLNEFVDDLRDSGSEVVERELHPDQPMAQHIEDLQSFNAVVAAGGDGTVSSLAYAARGQNVPILAYPAGTANLIAQNLDLPRDPAALAQIVLPATPCRWTWAKSRCAAKSRAFACLPGPEPTLP